jgi:hypothetical protein
MLEMIGRQRAILRGERGAVLVGLLGVELDPQAMLAAASNRASTSSGVKPIPSQRRRRWSPAPLRHRRNQLSSTISPT